MAGKKKKTAKSKAKSKGKTKRKPKPKAKPKAKSRSNAHGERVAIYFGKKQAALLAWARKFAAKRGVGLNRIVQDGLRNVHEVEVGDVHQEPDNGPAVGQEPGVDQVV
jgi:hypothetical protein